jgi:hypothetical protein
MLCIHSDELLSHTIPINLIVVMYIDGPSHYDRLNVVLSFCHFPRLFSSRTRLFVYYFEHTSFLLNISLLGEKIHGTMLIYTFGTEETSNDTMVRSG